MFWNYLEKQELKNKLEARKILAFFITKKKTK